MHKIGVFAIIFTFFVSCNQDRGALKKETTSYDISTVKWPKKTILNSKATTILNEWPEYVELDRVFDGLYTVENTGDLGLVIEDLITNQKLLAEAEYPTVFNLPQIKSRQKVFQTFVLKTKGDMEYRLDPQESAIDMIKAYNAMRNQFRIIANNTLDIKKLLEE